MKGLRDITNNLRSNKFASDDYIRLSLKRAGVEDAGTYCILAKNKYGCDRAFFTVRVRERARSSTPPVNQQDVMQMYKIIPSYQERHFLTG